MNKFGLGKYKTVDGREAVVDAVTDDNWLVGRINLDRREDAKPHWHPCMWSLWGRADYTGKDLLPDDKRIKATYWLNIFPSGPGQLRKTWEQSLIEASRDSEPPLCRVQLNIDAQIGEGLK